MKTEQELNFRLTEIWNKVRIWLPNRGTVVLVLILGTFLYTQSAGAFPLRIPMAASTSAISYQGHLTNSNNNPLTGTYNMVFRLYSTANGGSALWQEFWTGVQVSNGLFNVMLGSLTPIPQNVVTGNNTLWLGITVGNDSEMTPRVQLGSVPFAMQALSVPDGSITTAKLAAGAVTQFNSVYGPTGDSTTSTSFVDMQGRSVTLTTTGGPVLALFSGSHSTTVSGPYVGYWQIVRDNSVVVALNAGFFADPDWQTITLLGIDTPPAGTHTYKVQWRVSTGGAMTASAGVYSENLAVFELKR